MSTIHVCALSKVEATIAEIGAADVVSLVTFTSRAPLPEGVVRGRYLHLALSDIIEAQDGHVLPEQAHVEALVDFFRDWDRSAPLLIHCYAGVSRSTAAAFIALCALDPETPEATHAATLQQASPTATPNARIVALADAALGREGRMTAAIAAIGRGSDCFEGVPFGLAIGRPAIR